MSNDKLKWNSPDSTPAVSKGTQESFWIAVKNNKDKIFVFMAYYQNRPLDPDGDNDDCLIDFNGDYVHSVGWVDAKQHVDFDDFYEPLVFNECYKLLGWAEYDAPKFTGLAHPGEDNG